MDISVQELKDRQANGEKDIILIDVRENHERAEFNIGGDHVPLGILHTKLEDLEDYKNKEVIVYCRSGNRSGMACQLLQQAGFSNARNLAGGMLAWNG